MSTVLLTDHAWADVDIEKAVVEGAGHHLIAPYRSARAEDVAEAIKRHRPSAILTCWAPISAEAIAGALTLRVISRMGVGLDNIAVEQATDQGVWVTNVPDYCVEEVSDHAVALTLCLLRGIATLNAQVQSGTWQPADAKLFRAAELTAGVVGYGRIGQRTARKLNALGMRILASAHESKARPGPAEFVEMSNLLRSSDVVLLHVPLVRETRHLVDDRFIATMRRQSYLVNCSRGGVVDTAALVRGLDSGQLAGAALDVIEEEPYPPSAILGRPNVLLTPHVGFSSTSSVTELRRRASEEVVRVLSGLAPHFPCNQPAAV